MFFFLLLTLNLMRGRVEIIICTFKWNFRTFSTKTSFLASFYLRQFRKQTQRHSDTKFFCLFINKNVWNVEKTHKNWEIFFFRHDINEGRTPFEPKKKRKMNWPGYYQQLQFNVGTRKSFTWKVQFVWALLLKQFCLIDIYWLLKKLATKAI